MNLYQDEVNIYHVFTLQHQNKKRKSTWFHAKNYGKSQLTKLSIKLEILQS